MREKQYTYLPIDTDKTCSETKHLLQITIIILCILYTFTIIIILRTRLSLYIYFFYPCVSVHTPPKRLLCF